MSSLERDPLWGEGDEEVDEILVDKKVYFSETKDEDPLATGDHDEEPQVSGKLNQKRVSPRKMTTTPTAVAGTKKVTVPPPILVYASSKPKSGTDKSNVPNLSTSTDNEVQFKADMNRNISCVIDEAIFLFGMDPREYHPFYLRIYKYIRSGQELGYFKSSKEVDSCWEKFDRIAAGMMRYPNPNATFTGVETPYATFIGTGKVVLNGKEINLKRNEEEVRKRFVELEKAAKNIVERRRQRRGSTNNIRDDLKARLEFFDHCKCMTYPADCVKMNKLWQRFLLQEFESNPEAVPTSSKQTGRHAPESDAEVIILDMDEEDSDRTRKPKVPSLQAKTSSYEEEVVILDDDDNAEEEDGNQSVADVSDAEPLESFHLEEELIIPEIPEESVTPTTPTSSNNLGQLKRLAQLKLAHARKTLKRKKLGLLPIKKQAKLESLICSGSYFSKIKRKSKKNRIAKKGTSPKNMPHRNKRSSNSSRPPPTLESEIAKSTPSDNDKLIVGNTGSISPRRVCSVCDLILSSKKALRIHMERRHNSHNGKDILETIKTNLPRVPCSECDQTFSTRTTLIKHIKQRHNPNWVSELTLKVAKPSEPRSFPCDLCGKCFTESYILKRHMDQKHGSNDKPFLCQDCPKQYKSKEWLEAHRRQVHLGQHYRCDICSRDMQSGGKLWKHKVDIHSMSDLEPPAGVKVMQCDFCGERLLRGMFRHMEKNHPEHAGSFQFQQQDRSAFRREQTRKLREEGIGPTWLKQGRPIPPKPCPHCGQIFDREKLYSTHLKEAHPNLKHERSACHRVQGKKIPPTPCPHCDQIFDREGLWLNHVKEAHQNMKYRCPRPNCGRGFQFYRSIYAHIRNCHGHADARLMKILKGLQFIKADQSSPWQCAICEHNLKSDDEVQAHFTLQHQQTLKTIGESNEDDSDSPSLATTPIHKCPYCEEGHSKHQALRQHVESSHSEMCWKCLECESTVIGPADLQEHFMLEHTDRPESISEFLKKFNDEGNKQNRRKVPTPKRTHKRKPRKSAGRQVKGSETDTDSEAQTSSATSDDEDYIEDEQMTAESSSSQPPRRSGRKCRSIYKTEYPE